MKTYTGVEFTANPDILLEDLSKEKTLIILQDEKPKALMIDIASCGKDEAVKALIRTQAMLALMRLREKAAKNGTSTMSEEEIEAEIQTVREEDREVDLKAYKDKVTQEKKDKD